MISKFQIGDFSIMRLNRQDKSTLKDINDSMDDYYPLLNLRFF